MSTITSNVIIIVGQRALNSKEEKLRSSSLLADDRSLRRKASNLSPPMQHFTCEELNPEPCRDTNNRNFDSDHNNHAPDHPG